MGPECTIGTHVVVIPRLQNMGLVLGVGVQRMGAKL